MLSLKLTAAAALIALGAVTSANALPSGAPGGLRTAIDEQTTVETVPCRGTPWGLRCWSYYPGYYPLYYGPRYYYAPRYYYPRPFIVGPGFYYRRWWW